MRPNGISKQKGIEEWINYRGLQPTKIIAVGDRENDVEMLEFADVAINVTVGHDSAKAVADHIIDTPANGGWATILNLI